MPVSDEAVINGPTTTTSADEAVLALRLGVLISRFAAANYRDMVDFDHLVNDGLSDRDGNLISQMGTFTLLDRGTSRKPVCQG